MYKENQQKNNLRFVMNYQVLEMWLMVTTIQLHELYMLIVIIIHEKAFGWFVLVLMICQGIFTIRIPFFHHKIQGLCFCYFPNTKLKWNNFK
jgi:hypothetical protein